MVGVSVLSAGTMVAVSNHNIVPTNFFQQFRMNAALTVVASAFFLHSVEVNAQHVPGHSRVKNRLLTD